MSKIDQIVDAAIKDDFVTAKKIYKEVMKEKNDESEKIVKTYLYKMISLNKDTGI